MPGRAALATECSGREVRSKRFRGSQKVGLIQAQQARGFAVVSIVCGQAVLLSLVHMKIFIVTSSNNG
jgi:hypothetical protein